MTENKSNNQKYGEKLAKRTARRNGYGGIIAIPHECIGQTYERYMDTETGVITLVPCTKEPRVEPTEEGTS